MRTAHYSILILLFLACQSENDREKISVTELNTNEVSPLTELKSKLLESQNYQESLEKASTSGKNVLLFFNGIACVNCTYHIQNCWEYDIVKMIDENFEFANLQVDINEPILEEEYFYSSLLKDTVRTVGNYNYHFQLEEFGSNRQPVYYLLNSSGILIDSLFANNNKHELQSFLNEHKPS